MKGSYWCNVCQVLQISVWNFYIWMKRVRDLKSQLTITIVKKSWTWHTLHISSRKFPVDFKSVHYLNWIVQERFFLLFWKRIKNSFVPETYTEIFVSKISNIFVTTNIHMKLLFCWDASSFARIIVYVWLVCIPVSWDTLP